MADNMKLGVEIEVKSNADQPISNLKTQLREARNELNGLVDKFGESSIEAAKASQKVALIEDKMGAAKKLTDAFNPDAKFKGLGNAIQGAAGAFSGLQGAMALFGDKSKAVEETLLKVQGAMALTQGINSVLEAGDAFTALGAQAKMALNGIKTGIAATGIGVLLLALGAIVAYWDDIKATVSGLSIEQEKLNVKTEENLKASQEKLDLLSKQDNQLKLQGLSEKEILQLKIKQSNEAISLAEITLANAKITRDVQVEAAKRNAELTKGVMVMLTVGIQGILAVVDALSFSLHKIGAISDETYKKFGGLRQGFTDSMTKLVFDPDKVKKEGDETVKKAEGTLNTLKENRAGFQNQINQIDANAAKDAEERRKKEIEDEKERQKKILEIRKQTEDLITQNRINSIKDSYTKEQSQLEVKYQKEIDDALAILDDKNLKEEDRQRLYNERRKAIDDQYEIDKQIIIDKHKKELDDKAQAQFDKEVNRKLQEFDDLLSDNDKTYKAKKDALDKEEAYINDVNVRKALGEEEYNKRLKAITDARKKIFSAEVQARRDGAQQIGNDMGKLADIIGKQTVAGKALAIGQATINTYLGATEALKQKSTLPSPFDVVAKVLNVSTIILSGMKAVKEIVKTPIPGGGGGAEPSAANIAGGIPPLPAVPETTILPQAQIDQMASANAATRAYVVESDVTTNQERITRLNRAARIN